MIEYYLTGLGVTLTGLLIWFYSPIKVTLGQWIFGKVINTSDDFDVAVMFKTPILGKLQSCFICSSFWLSLAIGVSFYYLFDLGFKFIFLAWFTYPGIAYLYKKFIDNK